MGIHPMLWMGKGIYAVQESILKMFSTEDKCLQMLFNRYDKTEVCPACKQPFRYHRVKGRKCYECGNCANQIYPMKGTMFEDSTTPLATWFRIIVDFGSDHRSVSARSIELKYGMTYKTAWRINHLIRNRMATTLPSVLSGVVEIDETYIGGRRVLRLEEGKMGIGDKQIVFGMLERGQKQLRMFHIERKNAATMRPLIAQTIEKGSVIHHDNNGTYGDLKGAGYVPKLVSNKAGKEFRRGTHNNNIEPTWGRLKKNLFGTYNSVSPKYLQAYLDEFCFRYNTKDSKAKMLVDLIRICCLDCLG